MPDMCFFSKISKEAVELEHRFNAKFDDSERFQPKEIYSGFAYPATPVITNKEPASIKLLNWGLLPPWAKDNSIRQYTLNARIETIGEKPSFRSSIKNRCLIIADGFYEWKWLDSKGKQKQKYLITMPDSEIFTFAGLWSEWVNKETGEIFKTYTVITKPANELMSEIHNTKKRMPFILTPDFENMWLAGEDIPDIDIKLDAKEVS